MDPRALLLPQALCGADAAEREDLVRELFAPCFNTTDPSVLFSTHLHLLGALASAQPFVLAILQASGLPAAVSAAVLGSLAKGREGALAQPTVLGLSFLADVVHFNSVKDELAASFLDQLPVKAKALLRTRGLAVLRCRIPPLLSRATRPI